MAEPFPIAIPPRTSDSEGHNPFVEDERRLIDRLIEQQLVDISYQPIVDLRTRSLFAYEALARPRDGYFRTPGDLIDAAIRSRSMGKLGRRLRTLAIQGCSRWPLFLNLNAHEFADPYLVQPDEPLFTHEHQVYLEISEAVPSEFYEQCHSVLKELRTKGVLLAIDDFGAGSSSLKYIVELEPDIVKLDRELIMGCLPDSREFELLRSLTDLCHRMKAKVIAEGIETVEELKATLAAGVDYGQGFLLSVPHNPPPSFFWPPELPPDSNHFLREFGTVDSSATFSSRALCPQASDTPAAPVPLTTDDTTQATILHLEEELADVRKDLAEALEERTALADRLKRMAHSTEAAPRERRRQAVAPAPGPAPESKTKVSDPRNPDEVDALDFLRQIEAERAQDTDGKT